ncbi:oxidoreductase [Paenibacillus abyssi]|uniref:Oxidoreductase n=1 Tax=Paenibacillus abyssi TaxID=1340531 RepID=A0A917FLP0_9BACL|nr:oxidoreductase [Paenibacillus abyssi]GGF92654.1 oxidoreductase [Paenibacillus abyssi]
MTIHIGIIGYGLSGSVFHAPLIDSVEELQLRAIVSSSADKVHQDYPHTEVIPDVDSLLVKQDIDVVVVTSPNATHYEYAKQAILAGKHVVVEKPFTVTTAEAEDLIGLADQQGVVLSVYQNRRWDGDFLTVQSLLETGMLGRLSLYESHFERYRPQLQNRWKEHQLPGSGILYDLGSHLIDQALTLFGKPESVWADLRMEREGTQIVDYYHLVLGFAGGMRAILHSGSLVKQPGPRFQLHGDQGSFIKFGLDPQEEQLKRGVRPGDHGYGEDQPAGFGQMTTEAGGLTMRSTIETRRGCYEMYYGQLAKAISAGGEVPVPATDALHTMRIIEAAIESSREQRTITLALS